MYYIILKETDIGEKATFGEGERERALLIKKNIHLVFLDKLFLKI